MRRRLFVFAVLAVIGGAGCGGSTGCSDACQSLVSCENKLDPLSTHMDVATCTNQCNAGTCANKQQLIDCVHGAKCDSTLDAYEAIIAFCQVNSGCSVGG